MIYRPGTSRKIRIQKQHFLWRTDKIVSLAIYATGDKAPIPRTREDYETGISFLGVQRLWV